jgi:phenylalanyl-tRNA synthetase alpha subunit
MKSKIKTKNTKTKQKISTQENIQPIDNSKKPIITNAKNRLKVGTTKEEMEKFVVQLKSCAIKDYEYNKSRQIQELIDSRLSECPEEQAVEAPSPSHDPINYPSHYNQGNIEPLTYILENNFSYCEGNIVKYLTRYKFKGGIEDLQKAQRYLHKLIEHKQKQGW